MTAYGEGYFKVLEKINNDYLGMHNLNTLSHIENKIKCYKQFSSQPHEYYECFTQI